MGLVKRNNPSLPEDYFLSSFIAGLKDYIQHHLQRHKPTTLTQAFWFARRLEQATYQYKRYTVFPPVQKQVKPWVKDPKQTEQKDVINQTIADLRAASKCFKCREPWVPGHTKVCKGKQNFSMILVENAEGKEEVAVVDDTTQSEDGEYFNAQPIPVAQVSMHALCGSTSHATVFTLKLKFGKHSATALVDTGSDISFINAKFAARHKFHISTTSPLQVAAANGSTMLSETACSACPYFIQGHDFISDFRLLELQG